jgi:hypothetical protein
MPDKLAMSLTPKQNLLFITIISVTLLVLGVLLLESPRARQDYSEAYKDCLQVHKTYFKTLEEKADDYELLDEYGKICVDAGGCYVSCGNPCYDDKPYLTLNYILKKYGPPYECPYTCQAKCLMPP